MTLFCKIQMQSNKILPRFCQDFPRFRWCHQFNDIIYITLINAKILARFWQDFGKILARFWQDFGKIQMMSSSQWHYLHNTNQCHDYYIPLLLCSKWLLIKYFMVKRGYIDIFQDIPIANARINSRLPFNMPIIEYKEL